MLELGWQHSQGKEKTKRVATWIPHPQQGGQADLVKGGQLSLALDAWSMESRKGKNASDDKLTPFSSDRKASLSSAVSASGTVSKLDSHATRSEGVMSPSMYLNKEMNFSGRAGGVYS